MQRQRKLGSNQLLILKKLTDGKEHPTSDFSDDCHGWNLAQRTLERLSELFLAKDNNEPFPVTDEVGRLIWDAITRHKWVITQLGMIAVDVGKYSIPEFIRLYRTKDRWRCRKCGWSPRYESEPKQCSHCGYQAERYRLKIVRFM